MYALVMFVCYLDGGCADIVVDVLRDEHQCLVAMKEQRLRHAGCFPIRGLYRRLLAACQRVRSFLIPQAKPKKAELALCLLDHVPTQE